MYLGPTQKTPQACKVSILNPESIRPLGSRSKNFGGCLLRLCAAVLGEGGSWEGEEEEEEEEQEEQEEEEEEQEQEEGRVLNLSLASWLCGFHSPSSLQPHGGANCPL